MGFLGLVPGEPSSGTRRRQGAITKTGNGHARRVLVEAAWSYRFPARPDRAPAAQGCARPRPRAQAIAWKAQKRPVRTLRTLSRTGKPACKVTTAIARELAGYLWAIARVSTSNPARSRDATNAAPARSRVREPERRAPVRRTLEGTMWR